MKKMILFTTIVVFASMLTSCQKDYTCTCTITNSGVTNQVTSTAIKNSSKSDAENKCDQVRTGYTTASATITAECHI